MAQVDALPQLVAIGALVGLLTGLVIIAFRLAIDLPLFAFLGTPGGDFESLPTATRVMLVMGGALLLGFGMRKMTASERRLGVVHVMERLSLHQGNLPVKSAVAQFVGGALALVTGQSGGREGPAIHLGAATGSALGQAFKLPNNSMRALLACGSAAAIASSFNTPIAGVIFAMEVVMMEYSIASFLPVIVAAVTAPRFSRSSCSATQPAFSLVAPQI